MEFTRNFEDNRIFKAGVFGLLGVNVDAIVTPANSGLSHGGGLAAAISEAAGPVLDRQCDLIIQKIGQIPVSVTRHDHMPYHPGPYEVAANEG